VLADDVTTHRRDPDHRGVPHVALTGEVHPAGNVGRASWPIAIAVPDVSRLAWWIRRPEALGPGARAASADQADDQIHPSEKVGAHDRNALGRPPDRAASASTPPVPDHRRHPGPPPPAARRRGVSMYTCAAAKRLSPHFHPGETSARL
jgi:hypothetical protein